MAAARVKQQYLHNACIHRQSNPALFDERIVTACLVLASVNEIEGSILLRTRQLNMRKWESL